MNKPNWAFRIVMKIAYVMAAMLAGATVVCHSAFAADISHGKMLVKSHNCAACHGANLDKPVSPEYPKLAGQHADYLYWAMRQYQMGTANPRLGRNNAIMAVQVQSLSLSDMKDIAAYCESLKGDLVVKK